MQPGCLAHLVRPGVGGLADGVLAPAPFKPDRFDGSPWAEDYSNPYRLPDPFHGQAMLRKIPTTLPMMVTTPLPSWMMMGAILGFLGCKRILPFSL